LTALQTYIRLVVADQVVSKVSKISEITQIARGEKRTRSFLLSAWLKRSKEAVNKSVSLAKKLENPKTISKEIDKIMERWKHDILSVFTTEFTNAYRLARFVGFKKVTKQIKGSLRYGLPKETTIQKSEVVELLPTLDLIDKKNIEALIKHQVFWIGDFYEKGVSPAIAKLTKEAMVEAGGGSLEAGKLMKEKISQNFNYVRIPKGFVGTPKSYFSGLTANAFTVARVHGQMRSFAEIGVQTYTISNPSDKRTCSRCAHLNGKTFTTRQGVDQMHSELSASSKSAVKESHPWLSLKELQKISPVPGYVGGKPGVSDSQSLSRSGQALPPFHFKCRCTVDVSAESMEYSKLTPLTPPTVNVKSRAIEIGPTRRTHSATSLYNDRVAKMLLTGIVKKQSIINIGGKKTKLLNFETHDKKNVSALWKNPDPGEVAFYRLDREMGGRTITSPTIVRDPGVGAGKGTIQHFNKNWKIAEKLTEGQSKRIRLLDFVSGYGSRAPDTIFAVGSGIVIINNNGFKEKISKKYYFPTEQKIKKINKNDIKRLRSIKFVRLAEIFQTSEISKKAAKLALLRIKFVIDNSKILTEKSTVSVFNDLKSNPKKYLKSRDIKGIDIILDKVYKK
jgi:hypothetical protein